MNIIEQIDKCILSLEEIKERSFMKNTNNYVNIWHLAEDVYTELIYIKEDLKNGIYINKKR